MAARDRQPDAREGQAGPCGVAERPVVPTKPGNAGGGKGPQFKDNARRGESREIGDEPDTSTEGSEATGGVACQSEGIARLSLLSAVRQGVSSRRAGIRLPMLLGQRRGGGGGRPDVRGHREVRGGTVAGRTDGGTQEEDVSSAAGPAGVHPQAGREAAAVGHSDDPRSRGADGGRVGSRADLRGRPATGAVRLPAGPQRLGRRSAGPRAG